MNWLEYKNGYENKIGNESNPEYKDFRKRILFRHIHEIKIETICWC